MYTIKNVLEHDWSKQLVQEINSCKETESTSIHFSVLPSFLNLQRTHPKIGIIYLIAIWDKYSTYFLKHDQFCNADSEKVKNVNLPRTWLVPHYKGRQRYVSKQWKFIPVMQLFTSRIASLNSVHTTIPSYTGRDRPFRNSNPTIAGAKSISSLLATGTNLGNLKWTVPGGRHFSDQTSTWPRPF